MKKIAKALVVTVAMTLCVGCSPQTVAEIESDAATVKADFYSLVTAANGLVKAAKNNPQLTALAKQAVVAAAQKADPKDATAIQTAADHVDNNNLDEASSILSALSAASAPASASANTARAGQ